MEILHFGKCRNVYVLPHGDDAAAEAQRGLVTSLESDAKGTRRSS